MKPSTAARRFANSSATVWRPQWLSGSKVGSVVAGAIPKTLDFGGVNLNAIPAPSSLDLVPESQSTRESAEQIIADDIYLNFRESALREADQRIRQAHRRPRRPQHILQ
jgi:hypothetical protein